MISCERVVNVHATDKFEVYIGRSPKGRPRNPMANPYHIGSHGDRGEVIRKFAHDFPLRMRTEPDFVHAVEDARNKTLGCFCAPSECHGHVYVIYHELGLDGVARVAAGESVSTLLDEIESSKTKRPATIHFTWQRRNGYEVSSKGDKRFSALFALMGDGRTIEQHYQCDIKGYDPGGTDWKAGKGKPAVNPETDLWAGYLNLWRQWSAVNLPLMRELFLLARDKNGGILSDCFAQAPVNQARALATILNELQGDTRPADENTVTA